MYKYITLYNEFKLKFFYKLVQTKGMKIKYNVIQNNYFNNLCNTTQLLEIYLDGSCLIEFYTYENDFVTNKNIVLYYLKYNKTYISTALSTFIT